MTSCDGAPLRSSSACSSRSRDVTTFSVKRISGSPAVGGAGVTVSACGGFRPAYTTTPAASAAIPARTAITHIPHRDGWAGTGIDAVAAGTALVFVVDSDSAAG